MYGDSHSYQIINIIKKYFLDILPNSLYNKLNLNGKNHCSAPFNLFQKFSEMGIFKLKQLILILLILIPIINGCTDGPVEYGVSSAGEKVTAPAFSLPTGTYIGIQTVALSTGTSGADIKYTIDGSDPKTSETAISGTAITVNASMTILAYAYKSNMINSETVKAIYVITYEKVETPIFDPASGSYIGAQSVNISTATSGAVIVYTTDGSDPKTSGTSVEGTSVSVDASMTIRAYAYYTGMTDSDTAEAPYVITYEKVEAPVFDPASGSYVGAQTVNISTATSGAVIVYTTDGSDPKTSGTAVEGTSVSVDPSMTIKAYAYYTGMTDSDTAEAPYVITYEKVEAPVFDLASGSYIGAQTVNISTATAGAVIVYTTDGSDPKTSGTAVEGTLVSVDPSMTIKAYAYYTGMTDSDTAEGVYVIEDVKAATPTFNLASGTYAGTQAVTISTATVGADIKYTTDGTDPTISETAIVGTNVTVNTSMTVRAYAYSAGMTDSDIAEADYTISTVATPEFNPPEGIYAGTTSVTISTVTSGATIKYTTDGSDPRTNNFAINGPAGSSQAFVSVDSSITIMAYAFKVDCADSGLAMAAYNHQVIFRPSAGINVHPMDINITSGYPGVTVKYTTDGTDPKISGTALEGAAGSSLATVADVSEDITIKAYAYLAAQESDVITSEYTYAASIAAAITDASPGDIINVAPGTWTDQNNDITKSVFIRGANYGISPNLQGNNRIAETILTGGNAHFRISTSDPVVIEGFKFDTCQTYIETYGGTINAIIRYNIVDTVTGNMFLANSGSVTIHDNYFTNISAIFDSIQFSGNWDGTSGTSVTITDNVWDIAGPTTATGINCSSVTGIISGNTFTNLDGYGILLANSCGDMEIFNNTFDGITNSYDPLYPSYGSGVRTFSPSFTGPINIYDNSFTDSYNGIGIRPLGGWTVSNLSCENMHIYNNNFINNTKYGIYINDATEDITIDAENNYWGDSTGPTHTGNPSGTGDSVTDDVDYDPFSAVEY